MTDGVVTFVDEYGNDVDYKRYAYRVPAFLEAYPPKGGYQVDIDITDLLSFQTGLLSLLREAVIAGKKPADVGLPGIERIVSTLVCAAKLRDAQGRVLRSARASMRVVEHKDFEILETAANQRLLAALGFGGEVFNKDEDADLRAQGLHLSAGSATPPPAAAELRTTPANASLTFADESSPADGTSADHAEEDCEVTEAERRQVENLAKRVGQPTPSLRSRAEVKAARSRLGALDRQRRSASARPREAHS